MNESNTNDWEERFYDFASDSLVCFISDGEGGENNLYLNNAECLEELKDFIRKELALAEARGEAKGEARGKVEAKELIEAIHAYNTDGIKALKEAEARGMEKVIEAIPDEWSESTEWDSETESLVVLKGKLKSKFLTP